MSKKKIVSLLLVLVAALILVPAMSASAYPMTTVIATATNYVAGTTATYTIGFTMASATVVKSVDMTFDSAFDVSSVPTGAASGNDIGSGTLGVSGQVVTYTVTTAVVITAGTDVTITLSGITNPATAGTYTDAVTVTIKDTDGTTIDTGTADVIITSAPEVWVDDDYTPATSGWNVTHFDTIQKGINGAAAYGTVNVLPGTYDLGSGANWLNILTAGITVQSTGGAAVTIIDADAVTGGPAISIHADDVTFEGFTVAMDDKDIDGFWIWYGTSGVKVHNNTITEAGKSGIALTYDSTTAFVTDATVTDNAITDCVTGIDVGGCLHDSLISNNTITGCATGGRGINFAGGILSGAGGLTEGNTITGNTISNNLCMGIYVKLNSSAAGTVVFDDNSIEGNTISANAGGGILIGVSGGEEKFTNLSITHNDITNNEVGGIIFHEDIDTWGTGNVINNNNISGNVAYGINLDIDPDTVVDAQNNWWGDTSGPFHASTNAAATGDEVIERAGSVVDYRPWLTSAYAPPGATLDTWGVFRNGVWYLDITGDGDAADLYETVAFGLSPDTPLVGDWSATGTDTWGVWHAGAWSLDKNGDGDAATPGEAFYFGNATDTPLVGDFNGDGTDTWGVFRAGAWFLDKNGDNDAADTGEAFNFGLSTDTPLVGNWGSGSAAPIATQAASAAGWYAMCFPNPASTGDAVTFRMMGAGVNAVKVSVYDLGGGLVYQSNFETGRSLTWDLYSEGAPVANGIYLYSMIAKANGELIETEIGKLLILR